MKSVEELNEVSGPKGTKGTHLNDINKARKGLGVDDTLPGIQSDDLANLVALNLLIHQLVKISLKFRHLCGWWASSPGMISM